MNASLKILLIWLALLVHLAVFAVGLGDALIPLFISFTMAYLLFPCIDYFESRGLRRDVFIFMAFAGALLVMAGLLVMVLPKLWQDFMVFIQKLPESTKIALTKINVYLSGYGVAVPVTEEQIKTLVQDLIPKFGSQLLASLGSAIQVVFSSATSLILSLMSVLLLPVFFYYLMMDYEKLHQGFLSFFPKGAKKSVEHYITIINRVVSGYFRGQLMVVMILCLLYGIGLAVVGLPFGFVVGVVTGLLSLIPYLGLILGLVISCILILANYTGIGLVIGVALVFVTVAIIENFYLTTKFVGDKLGLSPLAQILALTVGGNMLGIMGMLLAIPLAAIIKVVLLDLRDYNQSLCEGS